MAAPASTCDVCGQNEFTLEAGFYYCNECGTKLQTHREIVSDDDAAAEGCETRVKEDVESNNKITSWEQINCILHALTECLIEMGAPAELKTTVLQIWCSYLRLVEVAFFTKRQRARPRLSLYNTRCDLKLLFNRTVPKSSYIKKTASTANTSTYRGQRKLNRQLLEEEHAALLLSQSSDLESTLCSLSSSQNTGSSANAALPFRFNRNARKRLKDKLHIDEEHIKWHEQEAPTDAPCHSITSLRPKQRVSKSHLGEWSSVSRKSVIISILTLALNQVRSPIQIGDILRWIAEGHLPLRDVNLLLPEGLDPSCYSETFVHLSASMVMESIDVISLLTRDLGISPVEPDLVALCRRFLGELALPLDLEPFIAKLIAIGPEIKQRTGFPAYEQHAMAYVLMVMKLLFGLDGVVEKKMDTSTETVNSRLSDRVDAHAKLFVWHEWQQYVAMRNIILEQLHYPTNYQRGKMNVDRSVDTELFLNFAESSVVPDDDNTTGYQGALLQINHGPYEERRFRNIHTIITSTMDKCFKPSAEPSKRHISFGHSLQPQRSYLAEVLEMQTYNPTGVFIPKYMWTDHCKRTVASFVNPMSLKKYLLKHHQVKLVTKTFMQPISHIQMVNVLPNKTNVELYMKRSEFTNVKQVDGSEASDTDDSEGGGNILDYIEARAEAKLSSHEELLHKVMCKNMLNKIQHDLNASIRDAQKFMTDSDLVDGIIDPYKHNPPLKETLPGEDLCKETVQIALSSFHYWVRNLQVSSSARRVFEYECLGAFPTSFQFLLSEAAYVVRCSMYDLYRKLDELEKHIFKHYNQIR